MNTTHIYALSAFLLAAIANPAWSEGSDTEATGFSREIKQVDSHTVIAGSLDLPALRAEYPGDVLIVDLRTPAEGTAEEAAAAETLGLGYTNIPVASATVDPAQVEMLRGALASADPETMVVVHCASGNRASMLWGAVQLSEGESLPVVRDRLEGILTKTPTIEGLEAYAQSLDAASSGQ